MKACRKVPVKPGLNEKTTAPGNPIRADCRKVVRVGNGFKPFPSRRGSWTRMKMPYSPLSECYKGRFPFRVSTTSYIYPDHILPNVKMLAPFLDEIELVLFESEGQDNFPDDHEMKALCEFSHRREVGFNIHLPIDISLGSRDEEVRAKGVSTVKKVIEMTLGLNPSVYTLHFDLRDEGGDPEADVPAWQRRVARSAEEISRFGIEPGRISIETLGYPFEWVEEIVKKSGFSICLDLGHVLLSGQDLRHHLEKYLPETSVVHLHGVHGGVDHVGIDRLPKASAELILSHLANYRGIVSIEVFSKDDLQRSLLFLEEQWPKE
jgi:sugar phosphate isomerase/epimerase